MAVAAKNLLVEDRLPAVVITLNRPETRNALSTPLMEELTAELERQSARAECRVLILAAKGTAFSAGLSKPVGYKSPLTNSDLLDDRRSHTRHSLLSQVS